MPLVPERLAAPALAALLLCSCAQPIPRYQAPAAGPTARLLMRGAMGPGDRYGVFMFDSADDCKGTRLAATGRAGADPAAIKIAALGLRTVDVLVLKADRTSCRVRWSFTPQAERSYLVTARSTPGGCSALIFDATDPDAMKVEASLMRRDVPGNLCVPLGNSKTIAQIAASSAASAAGTAQTRAPQSPSGVAEDDLKALTAP